MERGFQNAEQQSHNQDCMQVLLHHPIEAPNPILGE